MAHTPNAFESQIFEHFRKEQREIKSAITVLEKKGFSVFEKKDKLVIYRN